ncbi:hypothetical protein BU15DRAFT_77696 [Melanogaster broomeanus]|nr:hypothetical protein BU15DRAFT_77696 [Melanogaster broomeanus]
MTRTRKTTLSMKEFSHLVSESLDVANSPSGSTSQPSSFQRIFSRRASTPGFQEDSPEKPLAELHETPRKMGIAWPFSRSPRKNRRVGKGGGTAVKNVSSAPAIYQSTSANSAASLAATSTSSLGSLVPVHERRFQEVSLDGLFSDQAAADSHSFKVGASSTYHDCAPLRATDDLLVITLLRLALRGMPSFAPGLPLVLLLSTNTSRSLAVSEVRSSDNDPTPRATTFGARAIVPRDVIKNDSTLAQRRRPTGSIARSATSAW